MKTTFFILLVFGLIGHFDQCTSPIEIRQATKADPCSHPNASIECNFLGMPSELHSKVVIAEPSNLIIRGKIVDANTEAPLQDVSMYVYHTDEKGLYTKKGTETGIQRSHGYLHGWCKTDENGHYEIHTIRPAPYPNQTIPAHIHPVFKLPNGHSFYGNNFVFADDPLINKLYVTSLNNPGNPKSLDNGILNLQEKNGIYYGERDIYLDKSLPLAK